MNFPTKVYVGNLPQNCTSEALRSLFEKHGKVVKCDIIRSYAFVHFADGDDAKLAVDMLNNTKWDGMTLKVELSYHKMRHKPGMGDICYVCGQSGHWSKDCPMGTSRGPSWNNNSNNSENRSQSLRRNRGSSGSSGSFLQSGPRDSNVELLSPSSSSYYERNNSNAYSGNSSSHYHNSSNSGSRSNNNTNVGLSRDHSQNDSYYDSYPPPPPPPTRYRPYPSAYERRVHLPPLAGTSEPLISSLLSSLSSLSHYHQNNNNHYNSSSPTSHNNSSSSIHNLDPYFRPPPEYYERRHRGTTSR